MNFTIRRFWLGVMMAVSLLGCAWGADDVLAGVRVKAEAGDAVSQEVLGYLYSTGQHVRKDYAEAANWFRKAAEQGSADAQYNLGLMYGKGEGVPKDYAEAVKWSRKAAEQGFAKAQYNLALMYAEGYGVPKDLVQAHAWFNIAGAKGLDLAKQTLGTLEEQMTTGQKAEAMKLARELFAKIEANR